MKIFIPFLILQIAFLSSCKKHYKQGPVVIDIGVDIWYQNGQQNLFGPQNPVYSLQDVSLFYLINGTAMEVNNSNLDAPKGVRLYEDAENKANIISVSPNTNLQNLKSETVIKIGKEISDTITCEFQKPNEASLIVTKVWYNGELKWDVSKGSNNEFPTRLFKIQD